MADEKKASEGSSDHGGGLLFILFIILAVASGGFKSVGSLTSSTTTTQTSSTSGTSQSTAVDQTVSKYKGQVMLGSGSASGVSDANKEYIIIYTNGSNKVPIKISGWTLRNGRSDRYFNVAGQEVRGQSVSVRIPATGVTVYNPYTPQTNRQVPITLKANERAIITTGSVPSIGPVTIHDNFKINRCIGYIQSGTDYQLQPTWWYNCPNTNSWPGVEELDDTCRYFVEGVGACQTPKFTQDPQLGTCVNNNCQVNSYCQNYIRQNFNYQGCYNYYANSADFVGPEWRVFLNRPTELWDNTHDSISLYDETGRLVDKLSY